MAQGAANPDRASASPASDSSQTRNFSGRS